MEHLQEDWNQMTSGMNSQTDRITTSSRGKMRNAHSGKGSKRESRTKLDQQLLPEAEAIIPDALKKYQEQFKGQTFMWTHYRQGYKKLVRNQLIRLVLNNDMVDAKRVRRRRDRVEVARLVAGIIIGDHLLKAMPCVGDKNKVVLEITNEGLLFLQGTSLQEIRQERAIRQAERARQSAKRNSVMSFFEAKAQKAGHPTMHDPTLSDKKVSVDA